MRSDLKWTNLNDHIITWFREMVESGKPHFMFYVKTKNNKETIQKNFFDAQKKKKKRKNTESQIKMLEDGNELLWIHKDNLSKLVISPEYIVHDKEAYKTLPSYSSNLAMLVNHLRKIDEI